MSPRFIPLGKSRPVLARVCLLLAAALLASSLLSRKPEAPANAGAHGAARRELSGRGTGEGGAAAASRGAHTQADPATRARVAEAYGQLPMSFEANRGQTDGRVKFLARGRGYALFLTPTEAVLSLRQAEDRGAGAAALAHASEGAEGRAERVSSGAVLRVGLVGANQSPAVEGAGELPGRSHYFVGGDERGWVTDVTGFAAVKYESVYPGVDLIYYGNQRQLEYDFRLDAGADPARIALRFEGAHTVALGEGGDLVLGTAGGEVRQQRPLIYQEIDGARREVDGGYRLMGEKQVAFEVGDYDRTRPLVIDPVLLYSTFLGGNDTDTGFGVAVDAAGSAYVVGDALSTNFPGPSPIQAAKGLSFDAFVLKLNPAGSALVYATYLGGGGDDFGNAVAVDPAGNAYAVGFTGSDDFPHTAGSVQQSRSGLIDGFVAKLNPTGSALVYSTFLGGNNSDEVLAVAADAAGHAYVAGYTDSSEIASAGIFNMRAGSPVYRSADGGGSWAEADNGLTASRVNHFATHPTDAATIYAGTATGVFKTTDGGNLWGLTGAALQSTMPRFTNWVAVHPTAPETVYAATFGGVYKSTNGGQTYEEKNTGLSDRNLFTIAIDPATPTTLYAGSIFGAHKSTNGGDNWTPINNGFVAPFSSFEPQVTDLAIDPNSPSTVYAGTSHGVFKTTDGGANWAIINTGLGSDFLPLAVTALLMDPQNPSTLYAATTLFGGNQLAKTTNGGGQWNIVGAGLGTTSGATTFTPRIDALAIDPANPSVLYAGTLGAPVFKSADGGANWAPSANGLNNNSVGALVVDRAVPSRVFAGAFIGTDAFAGKLNPDGTAVVHFRLLGGNENDTATGVAADPAGNTYVAGHTASNNFPVVAGALQPASGGSTDAFLTKISPTGAALLYSTHLGGSSIDEGRAVAVGADGAAYVTGRSISTNFPLQNAFRGAPASFDAFVTKINPAGAELVYSTFLGGAGTDQGNAVAVDPAGNAYVAGVTTSNDFPAVGAVQTTRGGGNDAFVSKLNAAGTALVYSTYLGGSSADQGNAVAVDAVGNAYVVGTTSSFNFPVASAFQNPGGGSGDAFIAKLGTDADLSITKADSRDPVMVNNSLTYTLRVVNGGPSPATGVTVSDTLPAGVNFVSATPSQGSCALASGTLTCPLGDLAPQAAATVSILVTPTAPGQLGNTASVSGGEPDGNQSNNSSTQTTKVSTLPSIAGRVTASDATPLGGVTVTLSGSRSATTQTDANGDYVFGELGAGGNYTITPHRENRVFQPSSQGFQNLSADQTANFTGAACSYSLSAAGQPFTAAGGSGSVNLTASDRGCPWTATSSAPWLALTSGDGGTGDKTVTFTAAPSATPRSATLTIAGLAFNVTQAGCGYVITPASRTFAAGGGTASVNVIPSETFCPWTAVSTAPWISVTSGGSGTGAGTVTYGVAPTSAPRSGRILIADKAHAVWQEFDSCERFDIRLAPTYPTAAAEPFAIVEGDFNGDQLLDVVTTHPNLNDGSISFLPGAGAGRLGAARGVTLGPGRRPRSIAKADFNRDGKLDLITSDANANELSLLLGDGAGGFTVSRIPTQGASNAVAVGDFNRDGQADIAAGVGSGVLVLAGNGAGGFNETFRFLAGVNATVTFIAVADFNRDGRPDLAASTDFPLHGDVVVALGDGAGRFGTPNTFPANILPGPIAVGDFDGDDRLDLAVKTHFGISVLRGDGAGGFGAPAHIPVAQFVVNDVKAGDFDGDGKVDLVYSETYGGRVTVLAGDGAGGFSAEQSVFAGGTRMAVGDYNADGKLDVAVSRTIGGGSVAVLRGDGAGSFDAPTATRIGDQPFIAAVADFNNDGILDVVSGSSESHNTGATYSVLLGDGTGKFSAQTFPMSNAIFLQSVAVGDFNADGKADLVFVGGAVFVLLGDGAGRFGAPTQITAGDGPNDVVVADFNKDGKDDLAVSSFRDHGVSFLPGNGAGGFGPRVFAPMGEASVNAVAAGDFDGDGDLDLATSGYLCESCESNVSFVLGTGAGTFGPATKISLGTNTVATAPVAADFDGDGRTDLAVPRQRINKVTLLRWDGVDNFRAPADYDTAAEPVAAVVADFNADSIPDIATTHFLGQLSFLFGDGAGGFGAPTVFQITSLGAPVAGDFNRDGRADFGATLGTGIGDIGFFLSFLNTCSARAAIGFGSADQVVGEGAGSVQINVNRSGDTSAPASIDYRTEDGTANSVGDFTPTFGTLNFAAGETSRSLKVIVTDDVKVEGAESFTLTLSAPTGATLVGAASVRVEISDNDAPGAPDPLNDARFFVRQHYADFLNREPDEAGLNFWSGQITVCGADAACIDNRRQHVSAAFFLSTEFQQTGYMVYRTYGAAFGTRRVGATVPLTLQEFLPDTQRIGRGVVVNAPGWEQLLEQNKQAYLEAFVARPQFTSLYPQTRTPGQFVDALNANAGGALSTPERDALVGDLTSGARTRAEVLRAVAEDADFAAREKNRAFVLMQYYGYLRRNPNDSPEPNLDFGGYNFWLTKLNDHGGDFVAAEMVRSFLVSGEYRERFR